MEYLPTNDERGWLIARLGSLIALRGEHPFLGMPIVEPTRKFFPDPWTFSHKGLDRLVRRLMQYAGLGQLDVCIGTYVEMRNSNLSTRAFHEESTAGLFMGISEGRCLFGFNERSPADDEYMAGVMCHEVAHAYRTHHGLVDLGAADEEELLTDLTTVYLGFGILAANNSFRVRKSGWQAGSLAYTSWSTRSAGYLTPQAFAFLLAVQTIARGLSGTDRKRLLGHLEANQAAFTRAAIDEVQRQEIDVLRALQLSHGPHPDRTTRLEEILQPLPAYDEPELPAAELKPAPFNRGRPVFRVPKDRTSQLGPLFAIAGIGLGVAGALVFHRSMIVLIGLVLGAAVGIMRGSRARFEVCSDSQCRAQLGAANVCPVCGGNIVGTIKHENDRLEAEEEWRRRTLEGLRGPTTKARKIPRQPVDREDAGGPQMP